MLQAYYQDQWIEAGCDEAGRGCLAGPVYAAAVVLPRDFHHPLLNDSKQLARKDREALREVVQREALSWAVGSCCNREIDRMNILKAAFHSMHLAVDGLRVRPGLLLIDGNRFTPYPGIPHQCVVKGDATFASIAAASILAKTYRDDHMRKLHTEFPAYGWDHNMGYATRDHQQALDQWGPTPYHRASFRLSYGTAPQLFEQTD